MEQEKLKVNDLIRLREQDVMLISESLQRLEGLSKLYYEAEELFDVTQLEEVKRRFLAELQYLTVMYSKTRCYKNDSNYYLTELRKKTKADAIKLLLEEGKKIGMAEALCYSHPFYVDRITLIESLVEFFIKVEYLHTFYLNLSQSIVQSVSIAGKERSQSIHA